MPQPSSYTSNGKSQGNLIPKPDIIMFIRRSRYKKVKPIPSN